MSLFHDLVEEKEEAPGAAQSVGAGESKEGSVNPSSAWQEAVVTVARGWLRRAGPVVGALLRQKALEERDLWQEARRTREQPAAGGEDHAAAAAATATAAAVGSKERARRGSPNEADEADHHGVRGRDRRDDSSPGQPAGGTPPSPFRGAPLGAAVAADDLDRVVSVLCLLGGRFEGLFPGARVRCRPPPEDDASGAAVAGWEDSPTVEATVLRLGFSEARPPRDGDIERGGKGAGDVADLPTIQALGEGTAGESKEEGQQDALRSFTRALREFVGESKAEGQQDAPGSLTRGLPTIRALRESGGESKEERRQDAAGSLAGGLPTIHALRESEGESKEERQQDAAGSLAASLSTIRALREGGGESTEERQEPVEQPAAAAAAARGARPVFSSRLVERPAGWAISEGLADGARSRGGAAAFSVVSDILRADTERLRQENRQLEQEFRARETLAGQGHARIGNSPSRERGYGHETAGARRETRTPAAMRSAEFLRSLVEEQQQQEQQRRRQRRQRRQRKQPSIGAGAGTVTVGVSRESPRTAARAVTIAADGVTLVRKGLPRALTRKLAAHVEEFLPALEAMLEAETVFRGAYSDGFERKCVVIWGEARRARTVLKTKL